MSSPENYKSDYYHISFDDFFDKNVSPRTVLMVEMNNCHGELLPGYVKYLLDLNYNVDLVVSHEQAVKDPFYIFHDTRFKKYAFTYEEMVKFLQCSPRMYQYELAFITSYNLYRRLNNVERPSFIKHVPDFIKPKYGIVSVLHHEEYADEDEFPLNRLITLYCSRNEKFNYINPHFFGDITYTPKSSGVTHFAVIGALDETERRNISLLFDALETLSAMGRDDWFVTLIGRGKVQIPPKFKDKVRMLGKLPYGPMYAQIEECDFLLSLLDPNDKRHERYIGDAISGTYQLSFGFLKPLVIAKKFALPHGLTSCSSIIYGDESQLADAMLRAMNMDGEEYEKIKISLNETANDIYGISLHNMKMLLINTGMNPDSVG